MQCQQISCRKSSDIRFQDGTIVPKTDTAEYLGSLLHEKANPRPEIIKRIDAAAYGSKTNSMNSGAKTTY